MKSLALKLSAGLLVLALLLALVACGFIKGSGGKLTPPPLLPDMGGSWDFTVPGGNGNPVEIEAILVQATGGTLSANTIVSPTGPGQSTNGIVFEVDILGSSLSTATDMSTDYLGNTCGPDNGNRSLIGMIDASGHVTLTYDAGGSFNVAINGTFSASATPPFSGSFTVSAPGCKSNGQTGTITGVLASSLTGTYSGTSASDNTETITMALTETNNNNGFTGSITGNGTDNKNGNFTFDANVVGNILGGASLGPGPGGNGTTVYGYFDPQLGAKGSILFTSFQGGSATSCPNGVPIDNGSCLLAILALQ